ncbi:MAG TPA: hypothetical protein VK498_00425 [Ferruginibacter sp.]|nr:hypothetical protein [Ferruginibacter sp.]
MTIENYITSSCLISRNVIYKNGKALFENKIEGPPAFFLAAYHYFNISYPKFYKMDNLCKLGLLGTEILLAGNPLSYKPQETGVVIANSNASLDTDIRYYKTTDDIASPALFVYTLPNIVIGEICIRHNIKGENAFFVTEKFDPRFIEQYVTNLFNNNILQACICGWVEILDEEYKTVLFLVEKKAGIPVIPFTKENINKIYQSDNG